MRNGVFVSLKDIPLEEVTEKYSRRSLIGEKEMISWATMKAGAHAAAHCHPHEQAIWILSGRMDVRIGSETRICRAGDLVMVPPDIEHESWCPEDTEFVTMLAPPRADLFPGAELPDHLKGN
jgi:quercetin dioxygenase-like cupin family protein